MRVVVFLTIGMVLISGRFVTSAKPPAFPGATNTPTYLPEAPVPDRPLPKALLAWANDEMATNILAGSGSAHGVFYFTNISHVPVVIQDVQPTCGCTTIQAPNLPWKIPPGHDGQFGVTVNLLGKAREQTKFVYVQTDKGFKVLAFKLNILPPVLPFQAVADRSRALALAKIDRQAVFHGACAACHLKAGESQDGRTLYYAMCSICHEGRNRVATKTDLYAIKTPTNVTFWIDWIAHSQPGSLMPAFAINNGGPLSETQIANIARYLNTTDEIDPP